jgi:isopenicillin N synthase-like dioxygenase
MPSAAAHRLISNASLSSANSAKGLKPQYDLDHRWGMDVGLSEPWTFVVNSGDMLSYWGNDLLVSNVHRALKVTGEES